MTPGQYPDTYIHELMRQHNPLAGSEEKITNKFFADIVHQGLTGESPGVKQMIWKEPDFDLTDIQSLRRHLYLDELSRSKTERGGHGHDGNSSIIIIPGLFSAATAAREGIKRAAAPHLSRSA